MSRMTTYSETRMIAAPRETVFDLVADVERYPQFLPLWSEAKIYRRRGATYDTEQEVGLGPIRQRFQTRTILARPSHIDITSTDRAFRNFSIYWEFAEAPVGCAIRINLTWQVRSWLMQRAIDVVLPETAKSMVNAFETRARRAFLESVKD